MLSSLCLSGVIQVPEVRVAVLVCVAPELEWRRGLIPIRKSTRTGIHRQVQRDPSPRCSILSSLCKYCDAALMSKALPKRSWFNFEISLILSQATASLSLLVWFSTSAGYVSLLAQFLMTCPVAPASCRWWALPCSTRCDTPSTCKVTLEPDGSSDFCVCSDATPHQRHVV